MKLKSQLLASWALTGKIYEMPNARHGSGIYLRSTEVPSRFGTRASDRGEKHARLVNSVSQLVKSIYKASPPHQLICTDRAVAACSVSKTKHQSVQHDY